MLKIDEACSVFDQIACQQIIKIIIYLFSLLVMSFIR